MDEERTGLAHIGWNHDLDGARGAQSERKSFDLSNKFAPRGKRTQSVDCVWRWRYLKELHEGPGPAVHGLLVTDRKRRTKAENATSDPIGGDYHIPFRSNSVNSISIQLAIGNHAKGERAVQRSTKTLSLCCISG